MSNKVKAIWAIALLVVMILFGIGSFVLGKNSTAVEIGEPAPDFTLMDLNDNEVSLSDYRGQPVMLNFFATWCDPCIEEAPDIQKFQENYGDKIKILIIDRAEPKVLVEEFVKKNGSSSTYLLDINNSLSRPYGVIGQPETFYIDKNGIVREHIKGPLKYEKFIDYYEKVSKY
ncbi:TlpA family protein disulfide reductase [Schinkia azotoformans]|uniref:TlpA family protein disulfide reductase n=1 Tax=Schinkia azotoformans TaxID=1454 RepID=UPI002DB8049C|nr:TlpA disulfide reductase family protein [Schinkia azotoformans]MEC1742806.1 TlpA disulfide reductase family protein [Schinkia azotoformans]MEC1769021.1 TlpA disulfide reductase family protein [Schinkia azotoformans]MEC1789606.1 TlpA disulfide reductase family protein [Schinkia azotoformans]MED4378430.1 TlpA disulfide reductase family protein [Schinkia azotoformans]MED4417426.1 TlpA disulfide reductase family protein [Schinkia azotoformans]